MTNQSPTPQINTKKHVARLERERQQTRLLLWTMGGSLIFIAALLLYGWLDANYFQPKEVILTVNGDTVTVGEWQERVQFQRITINQQYQQALFYQQNFGIDTSAQQQQLLTQLDFPEILGQQVLEQLSDELLIKQEAERRGITVSEEEVEERIQGEFQFFPNGTPTPTVTPTEFVFPTLSAEQLKFYPPTLTPTVGPTETAIPTSTSDPAVTATTTAPPTPTFVPEAATATATPYTLDGFKTTYQEAVGRFQELGISEKTIKAVYEFQIIREKLIASFAEEQPKSEEQAWARHILVDDTQTSGIVRSLLLSGKDFGEVAQEYSKDTGSGANGGDLGWFGKGAMVAEFEAAVFSQGIGEIGLPVQSEFGYHIIQVIAREEVPINENRLQQLAESTLQEWLVGAREEATIDINEIWTERVPPMPGSSPEGN